MIYRFAHPKNLLEYPNSFPRIPIQITSPLSSMFLNHAYECFFKLVIWNLSTAFYCTNPIPELKGGVGVRLILVVLRSLKLSDFLGTFA